jgi:phosphohistidine phosphatase
MNESMRRLMLFRHAKAEKAEPGMRDRDRRLTARGREDAAKIGAYMARHGLRPDLVLVSPAARTRETWEQAAGGCPGLAVTTDERLYDARAEVILGVVKESPPDHHALLVIGHNPGLHDLARLLIGTGDIELRERLREEMPTSALVVIDFALDDWKRLHPQAGRLDRFVTPRTLGNATD